VQGNSETGCGQPYRAGQPGKSGADDMHMSRHFSQHVLEGDP
jgi:hypothetical protein